MKFSRLDLIYKALDDLNLNWSNFGVIPFTNEINNLEDILEKDTLYIAISGVKVLNMLNNITELTELNNKLSNEQIANNDSQLMRLKNAVFYDIEKFDQAYYGTLGLPLLNDNSVYLPVIDNMDTSFEVDKFLKPSRDLKAFNGGILDAGMTIGEFIKGQQFQSYYKEENAVIADCKKIFAEYRFFIVDQEVVAMSQYKLGHTIVSNPNVPDFIIKKAKEYCKLYQPHDIFTMDLADTPDGVSIVEYNCWNASGSYSCDLASTFNAIEKHMIKKYT
jgi:hypothetical protein